MDPISVVITCYREGKLLLEAVESVRVQSQPPAEIVIVNDGGTDDVTRAVCEKLDSETRVRVIWRSTTGGPAVARDTGFLEAHHEVLVPLDADDLLPPDALRVIAGAFHRYADSGIVYGPYLRQDSPGVPGIVVDPEDISLRSMLDSRGASFRSNWRLLGATPIRRSVWRAVGGHDPGFSVADLHDVEFWIRVIACDVKPAHIPSVLYVWRKYLGRNSRQVNPMSWYRIAEKHFETYKVLGLESRALELLLLGSKWSGSHAEARRHAAALRRRIAGGEWKVSSLIALGVPAVVLRAMVEIARRYR